MNDTTITLSVGALDELVHGGIQWLLVARKDADDRTVDSYLGFGSIAVRLYPDYPIWLVIARSPHAEWQRDRFASGGFRFTICDSLNHATDTFVEWSFDERLAS